MPQILQVIYNQIDWSSAMRYEVPINKAQLKDLSLGANKLIVRMMFPFHRGDQLTFASADVNDAVFVRSLGKYKIIDVAYCGHQQVCLSLTPW